MIALLKAEFRKLFTTRSTYVMMLLAVLMVIFFAFYVEGIKPGGPQNQNPFKIAGEVTSALPPISIFVALIGILLMTHEYRYNTILYTLSSSKSRTKVLLAKIITVSVFALLFSLFISVLSPSLTYLGLHLSGQQLVPQNIYYVDLLWRALFYGWGFAMAALLLAALLRNQIAAVVSIFILPATVEPLLGLLLKTNSNYLPFQSLAGVVDGNRTVSLSATRSAAVFMIYLIVGWIAAWVLFLRRDAN